MRNTSFFEKLTGSLRLTDEDLKALNEHNDDVSSPSAPVAAAPASIATTATHDDGDTIIEEIEGDFEIPEDAEIETIEEVVEDDTIDTEQVDEYYEEIIDEEQPVHHASPEVKLTTTHDGDEAVHEEEPMHEQVDLEEDYPVFNIESDEEPEEEEEKLIDFTTRDIEKKPRPERQSLPIDMYELHHEIIIRTLVPGITPEHLKVSITRDHVSISGTRPAPDGIPSKNYFEREVEWGEFSRMIELPVEVDVEHAEAVEKYGLLVLRLPKIDSMKTQELKVKSV
jgi:HSP20 family molecular chaperone IbpA